MSTPGAPQGQTPADRAEAERLAEATKSTGPLFSALAYRELARGARRGRLEENSPK